jgi:hypothetical protein
MKLETVKIDVRDVADHKRRWKPSRVYIFPQGETLLDNLQNRRSRPYNEYRKQVMPAVIRALGLPAGTRVKWSQYAGCSCPCSPGFVVDSVLGKTVYVDVAAK